MSAHIPYCNHCCAPAAYKTTRIINGETRTFTECRFCNTISDDNMSQKYFSESRKNLNRLLTDNYSAAIQPIAHKASLMNTLGQPCTMRWKRVIKPITTLTPNYECITGVHIQSNGIIVNTTVTLIYEADGLIHEIEFLFHDQWFSGIGKNLLNTIRVAPDAEVVIEENTAPGMKDIDRFYVTHLLTKQPEHTVALGDKEGLIKWLEKLISEDEEDYQILAESLHLHRRFATEC